MFGRDFIVFSALNYGFKYSHRFFSTESARSRGRPVVVLKDTRWNSMSLPKFHE